MDNANARAEEQALAPETPEDVAILYSWANLPGAKYRDFSASRREYRAQQRARVAETQRQAELKAARELEEAARREIEQAHRQLEDTEPAEAKAAADAAQAAEDAEAKRRAEQVLRRAEQRAEQERQEAVRRQQSAEELRVLAERAQEEMLDARKRAEAQAARYAEADVQYPPHVGQETRVLPGETSDPYYYTGPVDPAYFASTPGVRTAQATRVSTERKAYVYPMHPGSDEYDSGTIVAYRGNNQFAPSPAHLQASTAGQQASPAPAREDDNDRGYDLDDDYYDGGRATRLFSPALSARYVERLETAPADLHIRPAPRVSGEHEQQTRSVRPAPQSAGPEEEQRQPLPVERVKAEEEMQPMESAPVEPEAAPPTFEETAFPDLPAMQDLPVQMAVRERSVETVEHFRPPFQESEVEDAGRLRPIRYEEADDAAEEGGNSRMFIPSPRRRVLQMDPAHRALTELPQPSVAETRRRDDAAAEGERRSHAEVERREAEDRFVRAQEAGEAGTDESAVPMAGPAPTADPALLREEPVQWRSLNRAGESGVRRRRQPGREPVARTARQPRTAHETEQAAEAHPSNEVAAPPAWLSAERPAALSAETLKLQADGESSDLPATPGDPAVAAPRPVMRRQTSGLRPRVQPSSHLPGLSESRPETSAPVARRLAEPARPADEARPPAEGNTSASDTLQQSRERVASRWFALSGLMAPDGRPSAEPRPGLRSVPHPAPMLCVLSISGGVGKTSIVATLGRALSSLGEKVMLADTSVHGILPYYFGAREQRPGVVRTFSPPPGSSDAPVVLVSYDADGRGYDEAGQTRVLDDLYRRTNEVQRVIVDAGVNSAWLARTVAGTNPWVLVPVAPDMNSVLGTQSVERLFQDVAGADGRPVKPYYVLNQYDPAVPLHLDVREVLRQFLGDRLLPIMLHRSSAVSEALAEGMTVIDYAPRAPIATDYMNLATWVRKLADPGLSYARPARWSER